MAEQMGAGPSNAVGRARDDSRLSLEKSIVDPLSARLEHIHAFHDQFFLALPQ
jgi:hypothetical protein